MFSIQMPIPNPKPGKHRRLDSALRFPTLALTVILAVAQAELSVRGDDRGLMGYQAAGERLQKDYNLERVAREQSKSISTPSRAWRHPSSLRVPIQVCHHPDLVFLQPDMSISLGIAKDSLGIGFALGNPAAVAGLVEDFTRAIQRLPARGDIRMERRRYFGDADCVQYCARTPRRDDRQGAAICHRANKARQYDDSFAKFRSGC